MTVPRIRRRQDLANRLKGTREDGRRRCWVFQCPNAPGNASGKGLGRYCRRHLEHLRRHGDPEKRSYKATEISPYWRSATAWIKANAEHRHVPSALTKLEALMKGAGRNVEVRNLTRAPPKEKARATWARLREQKVPPQKLLAAILGTTMCNASDYDPRKREYRQVQVAKVIARMAGGQVKRWATHSTDPNRPKERVMRWYMSSEGLVLRELGKAAEDTADFLVNYHIDKLLSFHRQRIKKRAEAMRTQLPFST